MATAQDHSEDTVVTEQQHADEAHGEAGHGESTDHSAEGAHGEHNIGAELPVWSVIPFVGILLSIAIFPLVAPHFWHEHFPKVSAFWAIIFAVPFLIAYQGLAFYEIAHIYLLDYIPFIILLWGLFTVSGGIYIQGNLKGKPIINTIMIGIGTIFASWIGTTGAAMVMIRPLLTANEDRKHKVHTVVFFIFLVANIGGSLTPVGDPPLFLGFLHNVPFFWTLTLLPEFAFVAVILLAGYYLFDTIMYKREEPELEVEEDHVPLRILGWHNFLFLLGIVGAVIMSGIWKPGDVTILGVHVGIQSLTRDAIIILMGIFSLYSTREEIHKKNEFGWFPIQEVAYLFAGIFMTIIPALAILKAGEQGAFAFIMEAMRSPVHYFWITGSLSAFLDNAPTYLTFFNTALGNFYAGVPEPAAVARLIAEHEIYLVAISIGAVFFGAITYIGNAPNFMVKSIAEERGVDMPSFFGYMFKYSLIILVPVFVLVTLIFLT
ncbi:MAG: sodium:proton antiporter [Candidatus Marinimicrobia bacterium]|nr:sodium:proton antiporter [Candidatus Neomarinimicrobiota bacterium]MCF7829005.1 sodium:proton antiporter [Candidatus Neomarinimicrobiota bacterium]MCF7879965.1 sodium:proton antiporter [Candidatus Neomarinimicrobiota bacterium]